MLNLFPSSPLSFFLNVKRLVPPTPASRCASAHLMLERKESSFFRRAYGQASMGRHAFGWRSAWLHMRTQDISHGDGLVSCHTVRNLLAQFPWLGGNSCGKKHRYCCCPSPDPMPTLLGRGVDCDVRGPSAHRRLPRHGWGKAAPTAKP